MKNLQTASSRPCISSPIPSERVPLNTKIDMSTSIFADIFKTLNEMPLKERFAKIEELKDLYKKKYSITKKSDPYLCELEVYHKKCMEILDSLH